MSQDYPRALFKQPPAGSKCLICGFDKALDNAHIVPDKILGPHPEICKKTYRDHTGRNVFILCPNCHRRYDRGTLEPSEMQILVPHINAAVDDLNRHIVALLGARIELPKTFFIRYAAFVASIPQHVKEK